MAIELYYELLREMRFRGILEFLLATAASVAIVSLLLLAYIGAKRRETRRLLERAGLPTVLWTPRFWNYEQADHLQRHDDRVLRSTSITRMLPRMERLRGPLGMYGTVFGFDTAVIHVAHPLAAKAILAHSETGASKRPAYDHFADFCGRGVFTADGDDWRAKRVAVLHALLRGGGSTIEERVLQQAHIAANELLDSILDRPNGQPFDVVPLIQRCTIGLIFRYITHQDIPKHVKSTSFQASDSSPSLLHQYLQSVTNIRMIILAQSRSIWGLLPRWSYSTFAHLHRQEEETMVAIRQFAYLACRLARPKSPLKLLEQGKSHCNGPRSKGAPSEEPISQDLLQETITLLFAGQDTSAATLSWTLHLLSLHPIIQTKLVKEVRSVLGRQHDTLVTKDMIGKMPYLDAVIKESMRLYPVAPFVVRKLTQDISIPCKAMQADIVLPRNAMACLWIYGLHHHPDFWSHPEEFSPERWLSKDHSNRDAGISNGAYMPFALGPRNCLGQPLAHWILRALLARVMHRFEFQDARALSKNQNQDQANWRQDMQAGFTVLPRGGVHVTATATLSKLANTRGEMPI